MTAVGLAHGRRYVIDIGRRKFNSHCFFQAFADLPGQSKLQRKLFSLTKRAHRYSGVTGSLGIETLLGVFSSALHNLVGPLSLACMDGRYPKLNQGVGTHRRKYVTCSGVKDVILPSKKEMANCFTGSYAAIFDASRTSLATSLCLRVRRDCGRATALLIDICFVDGSAAVWRTRL